MVSNFFFNFVQAGIIFALLGAAQNEDDVQKKKAKKGKVLRSSV